MEVLVPTLGLSTWRTKRNSKLEAILEKSERQLPPLGTLPIGRSNPCLPESPLHVPLSIINSLKGKQVINLHPQSYQ
jgi:hypothetical protein